MMNRLFFELMQVSTGQLDCLSRGPSPEEWQELYTLAREQNVVGACYQGTVRLFDFGLRAPQNLIIDWMNEAEDLREQCQLTEQSYLALLKKLNERSLRYSVITGQGMSYYYTDELHDLRRPNGIDIFVHGGKDLLIKFLKQDGQENFKDDGRMVYFNVSNDTQVRLHYSLKVGKSSGRNKKLNLWLKQNDNQLFLYDGELTMPSPAMSVVLTLLSLYNQFRSKKLTMCSLMDYYFVLRKVSGQFETFKGGQTFDDVMRSLRLSRFAHGVMWLMQEVMGLERQYMPGDPLEEEGRFLLGEISYDNNLIAKWGHLLMHYRWSDIF